ncbi:GNAT family N-acetyltransferase [Francisella sp. SYW-2]|uniref:GNAT family N-acetyltransferase n=1 Tax=Francisella sp. SYW-2 TaxID=2610886 RepID=UPI00123CF5AE|nr:N-acetyltransferase [Francisella sp. SYW-2]
MELYLNDCIECYKISFRKTFASASSVIHHLYRNNKLGIYIKDNNVIGVFSIDQNNFIWDFCIKKEFQGQGYGKRMLNLIKNNHNHDMKKLKLKVWMNNERAISLYMGMGFNIVKKIPHGKKTILFLEKNVTKRKYVVLNNEQFFYPTGNTSISDIT